MKPKVAIVGIGRWGKKLLTELAQQADVVYAFYRGNADTSSWLETNHPKVKTVTTYEEILSDKDIVAVIIATPTPTHFELAQSALMAGKHVFLEKPGTDSRKKLAELTKLATDKKLTLAIGYEFAHHPAVLAIKKLIAEQTVSTVKMEWYKWGTFESPIVPHLFGHDLSILKVLNFWPATVESCHQTAGESAGDILETNLTFGSVKISSLINRISQENKKVITITTAEQIIVWSGNNLSTATKENQTQTNITLDKTSPVTAELADFFASITTDKKPLTDGLFAEEIYNLIDDTNKKLV